MTSLAELTLTPVAGNPGCGCGTGEAGLDPEAARALALTFKALGDPTRVQLLSIVAAQDGGEACVCDLTGPVGLAQATVSHHLKILVDAGFLTREQRGRWSYYSLVDGAVGRAAEALRAITDAAAAG
ncbi:ArsR/SmtB family transcription factor [Luteimicrobium sp. NPDC057192]|uniref:ArsR/SmtB family transcription factor n=1 Tax=Luteimicrobium sp. NPDC057192 TaxID=3346042 RepID=UPI003626A4DD